MTWDVIVVGAGTAGMPLAIFAAKRGARVLVLEQAATVGGTLPVSAGQVSAAGTRPDPAVSVPSASVTIPRATATAEPDDDPPGT